MSDSLRREKGWSLGQEGRDDPSVKVEQLLLLGLDHYFAGQFEQAIHVWTRVLFVDRGHARARAYIERARSALSERQRESEELLHGGMVAFDRGDVDAARSLITSAIQKGGADEEALTYLERLNRLESSTHKPPTARRGRRVRRRPGVSRREGGPSGARPWSLVSVLAAVALGAAALYVVMTWNGIEPLLPVRTSETIVTVVPGSEREVPVPSPSDLAFARARMLFERGHLHEALGALDEVVSGDALKPAAEQLRTTIQRSLLSSVGPRVAPSLPGMGGSSAR